MENGYCLDLLGIMQEIENIALKYVLKRKHKYLICTEEKNNVTLIPMKIKWKDKIHYSIKDDVIITIITLLIILIIVCIAKYVFK